LRADPVERAAADVELHARRHRPVLEQERHAAERSALVVRQRRVEQRLCQPVQHRVRPGERRPRHRLHFDRAHFTARDQLANPRRVQPRVCSKFHGWHGDSNGPREPADFR
jgi:hypothetical protein